MRSTRPTATVALAFAVAVLSAPAAQAAAPVAQPDSATTSEDTAITLVVTANDYDPDGDTVALVLNPIILAPTHGTATRVSSTQVRYTPHANYFGSDSFRYRINDGKGNLASAMVWLTITEVNDAPVANADSVSTPEDVAVTINVAANDTDVDGDNVTLISNPVITAPAHGTAVKVDGKTIRYTPHPNFFGSDTFRYEVGDGRGLRSRAWVTVTVNGVNDPPVAQPDSATTNEDTAITIVVTANDSDPDGPVSLVANPIIEAPGHGSAVKVSSTSIKYTPYANWYGTDTFRYRIGDGTGTVDSALVTVTVVEVNDAPVANADAATTTEEVAVTVVVTANDTDVDGDPITLISSPVVTAPTNGTAVKVDGTRIKYTPNANFSGTDTFRYEVGDNRGLRARAWVTITVNGVNDPPDAVPDSATTNEDTEVTIPVTANDSDPDGDPVTLVVNPIIEPATKGTAVRVSSTQVKYTPNPNAFGTDTFRYRVQDGKGGLDSALVTVTVVEVNDAPLAMDDAVSTDEGSAVTIVVTANDTDVDGDTITLISSPIVTAPTNGTAVKVNGTTIQYSPNAGFSGTDTFRYEVGDNRGLRARAWVTVTVHAVNEPPVAVPDSATTNEDTAVSIHVTANDTDPDGDTVALALNAIIEDPVHGTAVRASSTHVEYTPDANFFGTDTFRYRIHDSQGVGAVDSALVTVTVVEINDAPVANDDAASTQPGTPVHIAVTANDTDVDGDTVTLIGSPIVTAPTNGTAAKLSGSTIEYTPNAGFKGSDTFRYEAGDGRGLRDRAWVTVTVLNNPPTAVDDVAAAFTGRPVVIDVTANDTDPDGDAVTLISDPVKAGPTNGTAVKVSGCCIEYTSAPGFSGQDAFQYEAGDGHGGRDRAWVAVTVSPLPSDLRVVQAWDGVEVRDGDVFDFPDVDPGVAVSRLFRIYNDGEGELTIANWQDLVDGACFGQIEDPAPSVLGHDPGTPAASTTFRVRLQCAPAQRAVGQVRIESNDPDEPVFSFTVRGAVGLTLPPIRVLDPAGAEVPHQSTFVMPDTGVGQPISRRFRIVNDGAADLDLVDPAGLVDGVGFHEIEQPADPIGGNGGETGFRVRLHHYQPGIYQGSVVIETTDALHKPYRFDLRGEVGVPDFSLSAGPTHRGVQQGNSAPYVVTVTPAFRFAGTVSFSVDGLPAGAQAQWDPQEVDGGEGTATLWVHTDVTTPPGLYELTISGSSGALSHSIPVTLRVNELPPADFTLDVTPDAQTIIRGNAAEYTVQLSAEPGFTGQAALSVSGVPELSTAAFAPTAIGAGESSVLTIATTADTPESSWEITVAATAGGLTRSVLAGLVVRSPSAPGAPVIDSITPELFDGGGITTVTLTGRNFQGAAVTVATEAPDPDDPTVRVFPTLRGVTVDPAGTRIDVQVDTSDPAVMDFYNLIVDNGVGKETSRSFRVVPVGPVVDLVTPNEPEQGAGTYILTLGGYHLSGATVHAEPAGVLELIGVQAVSDREINGLVRVRDGAPAGPVELVVTGPTGRTARIVIHVVGPGAGAASRAVSTLRVDPYTMEAVGGPSPTVRFQEFGVRRFDSTEVTADGLRMAVASSTDRQTAESFSWSIYLSYTIRLFEFRWARSFVFDPLTGIIGEEILKNLPLGSKVRFGAFVLAFYLRVDLTIEIRITNTSFTWPRFCIEIAAALQIPGFDGFYEQWNYCRGGGRVRFNTGRNDEMQARGGPCAKVSEHPGPIEGTVVTEVEQIDCCEQPIDVTTSGSAFNGSGFAFSFSGTSTAATTTPAPGCASTQCRIQVAPACVIQGKEAEFEAVGGSASGTFQWALPGNPSQASIVGSSTGSKIKVRGSTASSRADDVELEVRYTDAGTTCATSVNFTVVEVEPFVFRSSTGSAADQSNAAAHAGTATHQAVGLPYLGEINPGQPVGAMGFHQNMEIGAEIRPCDPAVRCKFDFKRMKKGISYGYNVQGGILHITPINLQCENAWCDDDTRNGAVYNVDEDLTLDSSCSIFAIDTPGLSLFNAVSNPSSPVCGPSEHDQGGVHCMNFEESLEVDGVRADQVFPWSAHTRFECRAATSLRERVDRPSAPNGIGPGLRDCSRFNTIGVAW